MLIALNRADSAGPFFVVVAIFASAARRHSAAGEHGAMSDVTGGSATPTAAGSSPAPSTATPSSTPSSSAAAPASSAPAAPPEGSAAPVTPAEPGPVPYARFKEINDQLRTAREYQQKYESVAWANQFQVDPYAFVDSWVDQLAAHPQYQAQILAKAARLLNSRRGAVSPPEEPQPDVPIVDASGQVTGQTYSAKQLKAWREWDWAQKQSAFDQRIAPLEQMRTAIEHQAQAAQVQQQSEAHAKATLTELRQDPYFTQHEAKVKQALIDHPDWGDDVYRAYHHVLRTEVFPTIGTQAEAKVLDHLKTQAAGSTPHPGQGTPPDARPRRRDGESEQAFLVRALQYFDAHPEDAAAMAHR